jgi:hypothetical protein
MAAGATLVIQDRNNRTIFDLTASTANQSINLPHLGWQKGLKVTTLSSGNVQVSVNK